MKHLLPLNYDPEVQYFDSAGLDFGCITYDDKDGIWFAAKILDIPDYADFAEFLVTSANAHYGLVEYIAIRLYSESYHDHDWDNEPEDVKKHWRNEAIAQAKP